ncbi:prostaglandin G/H synthase 2-like, partial [Sipha flava]|uniref:prostaglandin-endoperoxide synthase n=1 Tax=Sipha flava TaxID=143950 RepID=A0A8B8G582_9HEMI
MCTEKIKADYRLKKNPENLDVKHELKMELDTFSNVSTSSTLKSRQLQYSPILQTVNDIRSRHNHCEEVPQSLVQNEAKNNERDVNEQNRLKTYIKTYFFILGLMMLFITSMSFIWHQYQTSEDSVNSPTNAETLCEAFDRLQCENGGYPMIEADHFVCKCASNYYGERCTYEIRSPNNFQFLYNLFDTIDEDHRRGVPKMWWSFLPFTSNLQQRTVVSFYQDQLERIKHTSVSDDSENDNIGSLDSNTMASTRVLPPSHPLHCPANNKLPSLDMVYNEIFQRKPDGFIPDPKHRNLLFYAFYQYFMLQFFNTDFSSMVTGSQLYGVDETTQRHLRLLSNGKLKTEYSNNEYYPPRISFAKKISLAFLQMEPEGKTHWFQRVNKDETNQLQNQLWNIFSSIYETQNHQWTLGHPMLNMNPMLFIMSTLWIREHNRVCDELIKQWPEWTDEQVYSASKRIVIGEMMGIMMNDILNAGNSFSMKHDPEIFHGHIKYIKTFNTPYELLLTTILPSGLPEEFNNTNMYSWMLNNNKQVIESGISDMVKLMIDQKMGMTTCNNNGAATESLTKLLMKLSRENAVQSFNRYRRYLGLDAYKSFYELTGNKETAKKLESLYENVDSVELLTGMLAEKISDKAVPTFTVLTNSFIVNSILTNPLYSETLWNTETFDGDYGFSIVKSANIKTFI